MVKRHRALSYLQTELMRNFSDIRNFLLMIIPKSDSDKDWINEMIDMMTQMMNDINDAHELSDLTEWFKLNSLMEDWDSIEANLTKDYSSDVRNLIDMICDNYNSNYESYFVDNPREE